MIDQTLVNLNGNRCRLQICGTSKAIEIRLDKFKESPKKREIGMISFLSIWIDSKSIVCDSSCSFDQ